MPEVGPFADVQFWAKRDRLNNKTTNKINLDLCIMIK
jgi:hypothetical protein